MATNDQVVHVGLLTDMFCSSVDICIGGRHHLAQRVDTLEECILFLLLLCCKITANHLPVAAITEDAYLDDVKGCQEDDSEEKKVSGQSRKRSFSNCNANQSTSFTKENRGTGNRGERS